MLKNNTFGLFRPFLPAAAIVLFLFASCKKEEEQFIPVNRPPAIDMPVSAVAVADSLFTLTVSASDPDGDPIDIQASGLPDWLSFDESSAKFEGTPAREDKGEYIIAVEASDGFVTTRRELAVEVIVVISLREKLEARLSFLWLTATTGMDGVSVAVTTPDQGTLVSVRGNTNGWQNRPLLPGHQYRMASVSKVFTAALVLRLAEEGHLNLDDPLSAHLVIEGLPFGDQMTIRQLLSHTAGLPDHLNSDDFWNAYPNWQTREWQPEEIYQFAIDHGPLFAPGAGYSYSNTGFFILGEMIQAILQKPLSEIFDEWIFQPLSLEKTLYDDFSHSLNRIDSLAPNTSAYAYRQSVVGAAGAIVSTPSDVARFGKALYGGQFVSPALVQQMTQDLGSAAGGDRYGLGTRLWNDLGIYHYGHTGALMDYRSILMYVPQYDLSISLATNDPHSNWFELVNGILEEVVNYYR
jgi:CubicO group peptidase (beta-lactamase class C family)